MKSTLDLIDRALKIDPVAAHWSTKLGMGRSAIPNARQRGRLSPTFAGGLARLLGEDPTPWVALAGLEAEPPSDTKRQLLTQISNRRNSYLAPRRSPRKAPASRTAKATVHKSGNTTHSHRAVHRPRTAPKLGRHFRAVEPLIQ
jgi:hypothetical protein